MPRTFVKLIVLIIQCSLILMTACSRQTGEPPWINIPGYHAELAYHEEFANDISEWHFEGDGEAKLTENSQLELLAYQGGNGLVFWSPFHLSGSFQLEYEVNISDSGGTNAIFFCAQNQNGEDIFKSTPVRTGLLQDYIYGSMQNYMITYNTVDLNGEPKNQSRMRKNPQYLLLAHTDSDPCLAGNHHFIDVVKMSNRIQFYVNGSLIHDVRDKGGFDAPVYMEGRFGFRIEPVNKDASVLINRVRLYQLTPI